MKYWKFYDHGNQDFVRLESGMVYIVAAETWQEADDIFLENEGDTDWTNQGLDTVEASANG